MAWTEESFKRLRSSRLDHLLERALAIAVTVCMFASCTLADVASGAQSPDLPQLTSAGQGMGTSVLAPSLSVTPPVAGAASATYVVTFTLSAGGDLAASAGSVQMVAPAGAKFNLVPPSLVDQQHPQESNTNLLEAYGAHVADNGEEYSVSPNRELFAGDTITLTIGDVINASVSGTYYLRLWTTSDTVQVKIPFTLLAPSGKVGSPALTLSSSAPGANNVNYQLDFSTSAAGALDAGSCHSYLGETIDVSFPQGTGGLVGLTGPGPGGLEAKLTDLSNGTVQEPECGYSFFSNPDISSDGAVVAFALATSVKGADHLQFDLSDITNPAKPGKYSLLLWTMSDPNPVALSYSIGGSVPVRPGPSGAKLASSTKAAGALTDYTLRFQVPPGEALAPGSGIVYVLAPEGTGFAGVAVEVKDLSTRAHRRVPAKQLNTGLDGAGQLLWFPSPVNLSAGNNVEVAISGAANPAAGRYKLGVWTSAAPGFAFADYTTTGTAAGQTGVTAVRLSASNDIFTGTSDLGLGGLTFTVSLTLSPRGGLPAQTGTIYLESRTGLDLDSGGCAGNTLFCPFTVAVTDLTHPADSAVVYSEDASGYGALGTVLAINLGHAVQAGDSLTVAASGIDVTPAGTADLGKLAVWTSADTIPQKLSLPTGAGGLVYGTVSQSGGGLPGWVVLQACPSAGTACLQSTTLTKGTNGAFALMLPAGQAAITAFPNAGIAGAPETGPAVEVSNGQLSQPVNITLTNKPVPMPAGASFSSSEFGTVSGTEPTVNWGAPSTYTAHGCKGGFGMVSIDGTNEGTGEPTVRSFLLVETTPGSGKYVAQIPPLMPLHGYTSVSQWISCPTKTTVFPSGGPPQGGTPVLLSGRNLDGAKKVLFGSVPSPSFKVLTNNLISAVVPKGQGTVEVSVITGNSEPAVGTYDYVVVTSITPNRGSVVGGNLVTIKGSGFDDLKQIWFGDNPVPLSSIPAPDRTNTQITVEAPPELSGETTTVDVVVITATGGFSGESPANEYTYSGCPCDEAPPPSTCQLDCIVTGLGGVLTGLGGITAVLNGSDAVGAIALGDVPFAVESTTFGASMMGSFLNLFGATVTTDDVALAVPVLLDLPLLGVLGAIMAGIGIGFLIWSLLIDPSGTVLDTDGNPIAGATVTLLSKAPGQSSFVPVPPGATISPPTNPETTLAAGSFHWDAIAGMYEVEAAAAGCHAPGSRSATSATAPFSLPPPVTGLVIRLQCRNEKPTVPRPGAVYPAYGPASGGNLVEISGTGLATVTSAQFGKHPANGVKAVSPTEVIATAPPGSGRVSITLVTSSGRSATLEGRPYSYSTAARRKAAPVVLSLRPSSGPLSGGTRVTVRGNNLEDVTAVEFAGVQASSITRAGAHMIYAIAPASAFSGPTVVTLVSRTGVSQPARRAVYRYQQTASEPLPEDPSRLRAKIHNRVLVLSWSSPHNARAAAILGYEVQVTSGRQTTTLPFQGTSTSAALPRLPKGKNEIRVRAQNALGWGPWSAQLEVG